MIWRNTPEKYGFITKLFHWSMALIVMGLVLLGFYMHSLDFSPFKLSLYDWHKSFGTLVLFLVAARFFWRFAGKMPHAIETHKGWEKISAHIAHYSLYLLMLLLPLTGWLMSSSGDFTHSFFGMFEMPDLVGKNRAIFDFMRQAHEILVYVLLAILALHIAGAVKHHIIDRDITLKRMLPFSGSSGFWAGLVTVTAFLFYAGTAGLVYQAEMAEAKRHATMPAPEQVQDSRETEDKELRAASADLDVPGWNIVPEESSLSFYVDVYGQPFEASFTEFYGDIVFSPDNLEESRVDIKIPMATVKSGSDERDGYMVMEPWFYTESFPESRFVADDFQKTDENQYVAKGSLTLRGVTIPVALPFILQIRSGDGVPDKAFMTAEVIINRLDFGIGTGTWSDTKTVGDAVKVNVAIAAERISKGVPQ